MRDLSRPLSDSRQSSACRLCGRDDCAPLFVAEGYAIERCPQCKFVQVRDEPDPVLLARIYENLHIKHATYRSEAAATRENERRLDLVRRYVPETATVLDAGCATGDFLQLAKPWFRVSGLDVSAGAISVARERSPELADRLWAGRIEDLSTRLGTFDAVCLWDVIEHLWDPVTICRHLFDRLVPGGFLFLSTPDAGATIAKLMGRRWAFMIPPEHLSLFARRSFRHLFRKLVPGQIVHHTSRGKWTNIAFLLYKLNRMDGRLFPRYLMERAARTRAGRLLVYVPTGDIQYLAVRKLL